MLENLWKIILNYFIGQPKLGSESSIKHWHCHAESYWENQQKQTEDKLREGTVAYNYKNVIPSFKLLPGCENANGDYMQKKDQSK